MTNISELLNQQEFAKTMGVSVNTLKDRLRSGEWVIPHITIGTRKLYPRKDIMALIDLLRGDQKVAVNN